jgi:hypothetical protein
MTNRSSAELFQTLNQHCRPSRLFETTRQYRETFNLRFIRRENVIRNVSLENPTDSRRHQVLENNNSDVRRTITISVRQQTSCFPPSYNDTMQQQSVLPPSYNDFIRKDNKRKETIV